MSEGGLLEKATGQNPSPNPAAIVSNEEATQKAAGPVEAVKSVALLGILPIIIFRAILVYLPMDELTVPFTSISLVMAIVFLASFVLVMWRLGLVTTTGLAVSGSNALTASIVAVSYLLMLLLAIICQIRLNFMTLFRMKFFIGILNMIMKN